MKLKLNIKGCFEVATTIGAVPTTKTLSTTTATKPTTSGTSLFTTPGTRVFTTYGTRVFTTYGTRRVFTTYGTTTSERPVPCTEESGMANSDVG